MTWRVVTIATLFFTNMTTNVGLLCYNMIELIEEVKNNERQ